MATSQTTKSWKAEVVKADPDWPAKRTEAPAYEFSNGREFKTRERPGKAYGWKD